MHKIVIAFSLCACASEPLVTPTATATTSAATIEASPQLSEEDVSGVIQAHLGELRDCYENELRRDTTITGRMVVAYTIDPSGRVTAVGVSPGATLTDANVVTCIVQTFREMRFPEFGGPPVNVTSPLVFSN